MNARQFADMLEGREYMKEITKAEAKRAKESGLLVAFGYSDDNLELRGVCDDEISACDGVESRFRMDKMRIVEDGDCEDCIARSINFTIKAEWAPKTCKASWLITASIPFAAFDIMEDGELFCRGCVIQVAQ